MRNVENYRKYFTKEYMMGPNVLRLLSEIVEDNPQAISKGNVLDLGCGAALSSIFLANETNADTIWAFDLWVSPTDNWKRICENGLEDKIVPIYGDALAMPFAQEYFNTVVSVDTYHYFGCEEEIEVKVYESAHFDLVWQEWFDSGHEYGIQDKEFLGRGLKDYLNFVMMVIKKKEG